MEADPLQYDKWIERALRDVVVRALTHAAEKGLPGDHQFYITLQTNHPDTRMPPYLKAQYPDEITIVLQHKFWDLVITDDRFSVTLSFAGKSEHLEIPFDALIAFADPSVKFGLQLKVSKNADEEGYPQQMGEDSPQDWGLEDGVPPAESLDPPEQSDEPDDIDQEDEAGKIVALDAFRKK